MNNADESDTSYEGNKSMSNDSDEGSDVFDEFDETDVIHEYDSEDEETNVDKSTFLNNDELNFRNTLLPTLSMRGSLSIIENSFEDTNSLQNTAKSSMRSYNSGGVIEDSNLQNNSSQKIDMEESILIMKSKNRSDDYETGLLPSLPENQSHGENSSANSFQDNSDNSLHSINPESSLSKCVVEDSNVPNNASQKIDMDESIFIMKPRKYNIIRSEGDETCLTPTLPVTPLQGVESPEKSSQANNSFGKFSESDDSLHSINPESSPSTYYTPATKLKLFGLTPSNKPRDSYRISTFNINHALSSTIVDSSPENQQIQSRDVIKMEYMTPRAVAPIIPSANNSENSSNSAQIISDSEDEEVFVSSPRKYKQPTLVEMFGNTRKSSEDVIDLDSSAPSHVRRVSLREYQEQKKKVQVLQENVQKATNLLRTIKLTALPDKGILLTQRHHSITEEYKDQENKLRNMVVNDEDLKSPPLPSNNSLKSSSWQELKTIAGDVQPKTFGKQAMATHNHMKALTMGRLEQIHGSLKTCPTEETFEADPNGIVVDLMPHQKHALAWLVWREKQKPAGGILADDMGLGKTLTMIALILKSKELEGDGDDEDDDTSDDENQDPNKIKCKYRGGTLIICPASLISQWEGEVRNRLKRGLISVEMYHGPKREHKARKLCKYDMVITTYAIAMSEFKNSKPLYKIKWKRIILDEAHQVRNYKSRTSIAVCGLAATSRWALTGTPIHNKELDLYALLKYLRCSPFDDLVVWKRWVTNKNTGGQERLNTVMSSLMLRRTKQQLQDRGTLNCLPDRTWELIQIHLEKQEMDVYQKILIFSRTLFSQYLHQRAEKDQDRLSSEPITFTAVNDPNGEYSKMHRKLVKLNRMKDVKQHEILVLLLRLRQVCCHPSLITAMLESSEMGGADDDDDDGIDELNILDQLNRLNLSDGEHEENLLEDNPNMELAQGVGLAEATRGLLNPSNPIFSCERQSTKMRAVLAILNEKVITQGDKAIIVSQWTSLLRLLAIHLKEATISFQQLDGTVPVNKRPAIIDNFNNPNSPAKVLLLSLTAGGVGLNLVGANHLLLLDLHWNPQLEMQAQDRIYRVGQKKPVYVYKFMAVDTIEERIKALQDQKKNIAESMLTGAKMQQSKLSFNDLKMLFNM